jgi:hypothetical protein
VQAHRELRTELGTDRISITDIFRYPTLAALAQHLGSTARGTPNTGTVEGAAIGSVGNGAAGPPTGAEAGEAQAQARADAMARRRMLRTGRDG